ncbi:MAG: hypothetical protein Q4C72_09235 [Eubacteriales bacterium]|nr:hypothetical protein [Eubacteriales bacterium]
MSTFFFSFTRLFFFFACVPGAASADGAAACAETAVFFFRIHGSFKARSLLRVHSIAVILEKKP